MTVVSLKGINQFFGHFFKGDQDSILGQISTTMLHALLKDFFRRFWIKLLKAVIKLEIEWGMDHPHIQGHFYGPFGRGPTTPGIGDNNDHHDY